MGRQTARRNADTRPAHICLHEKYQEIFQLAHNCYQPGVYDISKRGNVEYIPMMCAHMEPNG